MWTWKNIALLLVTVGVNGAPAIDHLEDRSAPGCWRAGPIINSLHEHGIASAYCSSVLHIKPTTIKKTVTHTVFKSLTETTGTATITAPPVLTTAVTTSYSTSTVSQCPAVKAKRHAPKPSFLQTYPWYEVSSACRCLDLPTSTHTETAVHTSTSTKISDLAGVVTVTPTSVSTVTTSAVVTVTILPSPTPTHFRLQVRANSFTPVDGYYASDQNDGDGLDFPSFLANAGSVFTITQAGHLVDINTGYVATQVPTVGVSQIFFYPAQQALDWGLTFPTCSVNLCDMSLSCIAGGETTMSVCPYTNPAGTVEYFLNLGSFLQTSCASLALDVIGTS